MEENQSMYPGSAPSTKNHYVKVDGIDYDDFVLTAEAMPEDQKRRALQQLSEYLLGQQSNFLGYQVNQKFDYKKNLSEFLNIHINNIGDPFVSGNMTVNTKFVERAALDYFASLWHARWPHETPPPKKGDVCSGDWQDSYWGYILSMGSSEGNLYALWNARDYLQGKYLLIDKESENNGIGMHILSRHGQDAASESNAFKPIAFYSSETHYSIIKGSWILEIDSFYSEAAKKGYRCPLTSDDYPHGYSKNYIAPNGWPKEVPSNTDGSVHIPALKKLVDFFAKLGYPPMLIFNYGATFKGAYDNVQEAMEEITPILKENDLYEREIEFEDGSSDTRSGYWVHVDGALGAAYMPFLERIGDIDFPVFDFRIPEVHSICMSGHKWIGAPWPCGIFMSKVKYQMRPVEDPEYIGSPDTTFSGSRNGFSALILWDFISSNSVERLTERIRRGEELAQYAIKKLVEVQKAHKDLKLWIEYSPHALTIRFRQANDRIVFDYSLSNETLFVNGETRSYSHIYLMDSVTKGLIDKFTDDLKAKDAFKSDEDLKKRRHIHGRGLGFK